MRNERRCLNPRKQKSAALGCAFTRGAVTVWLVTRMRACLSLEVGATQDDVSHQAQSGPPCTEPVIEAPQCACSPGPAEHREGKEAAQAEAVQRFKGHFEITRKSNNESQASSGSRPRSGA